MSGSPKDASALAASIKKATSVASSLTAPTAKSPAASASIPSSVAPFAQRLRLPELVQLLGTEQGTTPGWLVLGGVEPADNLLALAADDVSAVLWISTSNQIHLSTSGNGVLVLDCNAIKCPIPGWQRKVVVALLLGLIDRLPLPFAALPASSANPL